jgi:hypothetical protein
MRMRTGTRGQDHSRPAKLLLSNRRGIGRYEQGPNCSISFRQKKGFSFRMVRFFFFFLCSPDGQRNVQALEEEKNSQTETFLYLFMSAQYPPLSFSSSSATDMGNETLFKLRIPGQAQLSLATDDRRLLCKMCWVFHKTCMAFF